MKQWNREVYSLTSLSDKESTCWEKTNSCLHTLSKYRQCYLKLQRITLEIEIPHIAHFLKKLTPPILTSQLEIYTRILEVAACLYMNKDLTLDLNTCTFSSIYNIAKRFPWYLTHSFIIIPAYILCYSLQIRRPNKLLRTWRKKI